MSLVSYRSYVSYMRVVRRFTFQSRSSLSPDLLDERIGMIKKQNSTNHASPAVFFPHRRCLSFCPKGAAFPISNFVLHLSFFGKVYPGHNNYRTQKQIQTDGFTKIKESNNISHWGDGIEIDAHFLGFHFLQRKKVKNRC